MTVCSRSECPIERMLEAIASRYEGKRQPVQEHVISCVPEAFPNQSGALTCGKLRGWTVDKEGGVRAIPDHKLWSKDANEAA